MVAIVNMSMNQTALHCFDKKDTKYVQSAVGTMLYYARAIAHSMLVALNDIGIDQYYPNGYINVSINVVHLMLRPQ